MKLESKQDFQNAAISILHPLKKLYSPGNARLDLGGTGATYPPQTAELEAFSRPLWALAPFWAGGGREEEFASIYRAGLANGTDPGHPEYWGGFTDCDQRFVEMAAIAWGLLLAPETLWQPLAEAERQRLAAWLGGINRHQLPSCNWQLFRVLVNLALRRHGMPWDAAGLEAALNAVESYYLGEGWYQDGDSRQKDYYISFAIHYYCLLYARVMEDEDPERSAEYKARATRFARDFIYWFDDTGPAVPYGRSLTYRFAQASFWSACLFAGVRPYPVEVMKGLLARHLDYWLAKPIAGRDGTLAIGYGYPNLAMAERYNAPGSPYWGMKLFLVLALPDEDPFWRAPAAAMPGLDTLRPMPKAEMLLHRRGGHVSLYPAGIYEQPGHGHSAEKYAKFAYSTGFGFSIAHSQYSLAENAPDSMLAFEINGIVYIRKGSTAWKIEKDCIQTQWSPVGGVRVVTTIYPGPKGHLRRHEVHSDTVCRATDCGFALPRFAEGYREACEGPAAEIMGGGYYCAVRGKGPGATGRVLQAHPNTNLLFAASAIPCVHYHVGLGKTLLETRVEDWVDR